MSSTNKPDMSQFTLIVHDIHRLKLLLGDDFNQSVYQYDEKLHQTLIDNNISYMMSVLDGYRESMSNAAMQGPLYNQYEKVVELQDQLNIENNN